MGCMPSSTYPEHFPHTRGASTVMSSATAAAPNHAGFTRDMSLANAHTGGITASKTFSHSSNLAQPFPRNPLSTRSSTYNGQLTRTETHGDTLRDGLGAASTQYVTSSGKRYKFQYGRPVGFSGAEEIISCIDESGMQGNLYRLVRSKLVSISEEVVERPAVEDETFSDSEAKQRGQGIDGLVATSVTARRLRPEGRATSEKQLQEQYIVALLGTSAIMDVSAIVSSRRQSGATTATQRDAVPTPSPGLSPAAAAAVGPPTEEEDEDEEEKNYELHPQAHYSVLPAQRKPGAAVPAALCPPSRTLRVPVQYSAVEDRLVMGPAGKAETWTDKMRPQRMFHLATSETRTWAFYNDSDNFMHVFTLFDRASRLEPRDSTRLWPSSVFDDGNETPTPPPLFFGVLAEEEGLENGSAGGEVAESSARRHQRLFGAHGMWLAELLIPPRATRVFVEGKIRGAYRMRCTRFSIDDLEASTEAALAVAKQRNTRRAKERASAFAPSRGRRRAAPELPSEAESARKDGVSTPRKPLSPPSPGREVQQYSTLLESQGVLTRQTYTRRATTASQSDVSGGDAALNLSLSRPTEGASMAAGSPLAKESTQVMAPPPPPPPSLALSELPSTVPRSSGEEGSTAMLTETHARQTRILEVPVEAQKATTAAEQKGKEKETKDAHESSVRQNEAPTTTTATATTTTTTANVPALMPRGSSSSPLAAQHPPPSATPASTPAAAMDEDDNDVDFARVRPGRQRHAAGRSPRVLDAASLQPPSLACPPPVTPPPISSVEAPSALSARPPVRSSFAPLATSSSMERPRASVTPSWHQKTHALTPTSSAQSDRFRRLPLLPSVSSCRTVPVDDEDVVAASDAEAASAGERVTPEPED